MAVGGKVWVTVPLSGALVDADQGKESTSEASAREGRERNEKWEGADEVGVKGGGHEVKARETGGSSNGRRDGSGEETGFSGMSVPGLRKPAKRRPTP